jgi:hypothetical protein
LQIIDKESGELSGKGNFHSKVVFKYGGGIQKQDARVKMMVNVWVKDGRCKYEFANFDVDVFDNEGSHLGLRSSSQSPEKWAMVKQDRMDEIYSIVKASVEKSIKDRFVPSLKAKMANSTKSDF